MFTAYFTPFSVKVKRGRLLSLFGFSEWFVISFEDETYFKEFVV